VAPVTATTRGRSIFALVGLLVVVEFSSGVLQGYYTPQLTDIARLLDIRDPDVNWLEAAQLMLSTIAVPILAKAGDLVGHRRMLLVSLAITAVASLGLAATSSFPLFVALWAIQGVYSAWLPLEVALIALRAIARPDPAAATRAGSGVIVAALEIGAITGALAGGSATMVLGSLHLSLLVPGVLVTIAFFAVLLGVPAGEGRSPGRIDAPGAVLLAMALGVLTGGLSLLRLTPGAATPWLVTGAGVLLLGMFVLLELRTADPLIDIRVLARPSLWPVQLTALLFGVSVLGAQGPLSTFARTDPKAVGYGLGLGTGALSIIIGVYVLFLLIGALLLGPVSRRVGARRTLIAGAVVVGVGYLALVPFHATLVQLLVAMAVAGLGSGVLVAALPAAAAAVAPAGRTAVATGLTNTGKTLGGAFASCAFAIALANGAPLGPDGRVGTAGSLSGYLTVWIICGVTALVAAACLAVVPKGALERVPVAVAVES
jgi:MFS family permease